MSTFRLALAALSCIAVSSSFPGFVSSEPAGFNYMRNTDLTGAGFVLLPASAAQPNPFPVINTVNECDVKCLAIPLCRGYIMDIERSICSLASVLGAIKPNATYFLSAVRRDATFKPVINTTKSEDVSTTPAEDHIVPDGIQSTTNDDQIEPEGGQTTPHQDPLTGGSSALNITLELKSIAKQALAKIEPEMALVDLNQVRRQIVATGTIYYMKLTALTPDELFKTISCKVFEPIRILEVTKLAESDTQDTAVVEAPSDTPKFIIETNSDKTGAGFVLLPASADQPNPFRIVNTMNECEVSCLAQPDCKGYVFKIYQGKCFLASQLGAKQADSTRTLTAVRKGSPVDGKSIPGGITTESNITPALLETATLALRQIEPSMTLVKILEAKTQVVSGMKYYFKITAQKPKGPVVGMSYSVWSQPWTRTFKVTRT